MTCPTKKLVCEFLEVFSRFEYALKRTDFLKKGARGAVEPNWDTFANSLDKGTSLDSVGFDEFRKAVAYLFEHLPQKQIVDASGRLEWEPYQISHDKHYFSELLMLVRRVRNNLFHGGKFPNGYENGPERDGTLINYSLVILRECLSLNADVNREFQYES